MGKAWQNLNLEGGGLQAVNALLAARMRRRPRAYAAWALFPLGLHRFYLAEPRGGVAFLVLSATRRCNGMARSGLVVAAASSSLGRAGRPRPVLDRPAGGRLQQGTAHAAVPAQGPQPARRLPRPVPERCRPGDGQPRARTPTRPKRKRNGPDMPHQTGKTQRTGTSPGAAVYPRSTNRRRCSASLRLNVVCAGAALNDLTAFHPHPHVPQGQESSRAVSRRSRYPDSVSSTTCTLAG
jgi:hypothetical protein